MIACGRKGRNCATTNHNACIDGECVNTDSESNACGPNRENCLKKFPNVNPLLVGCKDGKCIDLSTDLYNCGKYNTIPMPGQVCIGGVLFNPNVDDTQCGPFRFNCQQTYGETGKCSGEFGCVDIATDARMCGGRSAPCRAETPNCCPQYDPVTRKYIGSTCVNLQTGDDNGNYCGSCKIQCGPEEKCVNGRCVPKNTPTPNPEPNDPDNEDDDDSDVPVVPPIPGVDPSPTPGPSPSDPQQPQNPNGPTVGPKPTPFIPTPGPVQPGPDKTVVTKYVCNNLQFQRNWKYCSQCRSMVYAGVSGLCPQGGYHNVALSSEYRLGTQMWSECNTQPGWKWCRKCSTLCFAEYSNLYCAAGGSHDVSTSATYFICTNHVHGQLNWLWCKNCSVLYFSDSNKTPTVRVCASPSGLHDGSSSSRYQVGYYLTS